MDQCFAIIAEPIAVTLMTNSVPASKERRVYKQVPFMDELVERAVTAESQCF